jgi:hypothetical protein
MRASVILLLASFAAGCASLRGPHAPPPTTAPRPDSAKMLTAWAKPVESLRNLRFTPDASVMTPAGQVSGGMAVRAFADGQLEGMDYTDITLTRRRMFACDDRVVVVEGAYSAVVTAAKTEAGVFAMRATVSADGTPHVSLLQLGKAVPRVASIAQGCQLLGPNRYASRSAGVALFGPGWVASMTGRNALDEMRLANWSCPQDSLCVGAHHVMGRVFAEAYARLHARLGVQLVGGRLWVTRTQGYRLGSGSVVSGPVTLINTIDVLGASAYYEWHNLRIAVGPALIRSSWHWDANIERAESLGFNGAHITFLSPAFLGSATYALPISSRIALVLTAVDEHARAVAPPGILEFQPRDVSQSGAVFAVGVGIRP